MCKQMSFILLFGMILLSCQNNDKPTLSQLVQEWQGKEIHFPRHPVFTRFVWDTIDYQIPESEYKMLFYVDSAGCLSCKLQLSRWLDFIHQVDSTIDGDIPFLFFLQQKDWKEILPVLRRENFNYPVCIDENGELEKLNRFPQDPAFHSFLLDNVEALANEKPSSSICPYSGNGCIVRFSDGTMTTISDVSSQS